MDWNMYSVHTHTCTRRDSQNALKILDENGVPRKSVRS